MELGNNILKNVLNCNILINFEKYGNMAIAQAKRENEIYEKYLITFAKKIKLNEPTSKLEPTPKNLARIFLVEGRKAIKWRLEKEKYGIYDHY